MNAFLPHLLFQGPVKDKESEDIADLPPLTQMCTLAALMHTKSVHMLSLTLTAGMAAITI